MKKLASVAVAGALLLSVTGVAFAYSNHNYGQSSSVTQKGTTLSLTGAVSVSGGNAQTGSGMQVMLTGDSGSTAESLTVGNVNVGKSGKVSQTAFTGSATVAGSVSGMNTQTGSSSHHHSSSSQFMATGDSGSYAGSATVSNVNVQL